MLLILNDIYGKQKTQNIRSGASNGKYTVVCWLVVWIQFAGFDTYTSRRTVRWYVSGRHTGSIQFFSKQDVQYLWYLSSDGYSLGRGGQMTKRVCCWDAQNNASRFVSAIFITHVWS